MGANTPFPRNGLSSSTRSEPRSKLPKDLEWTSKPVKSALETYWNTPSYVSAKAAATSTKLQPPPLRGDLISAFQTLGYLETPTTGIDHFISSGVVHPIFSSANWLTDLPRTLDVHCLMLPALRLASEIIECEEFMGWWMHVREGKPVRRSRSSSAFLRCTERVYNVEALRKELLQFGERIRFTWLCPKAMGGSHAFSVGNIPGFLKVLDCNGPRSLRRRKDMRTSNPIIAIPMRYYHRLLSSSNFSPSQNLRFQFLFAKMLIHELGHCWYTHCHGPLRRPRWKGSGGEVKAFESELFPEMGFSLEWSIFGANVTTLDFGKHDCATVGPLVATRPQDEYPVIMPAMTFVPMAWLVQWFQMTTWADASRIREETKVRTIDGHSQMFQIMRFQDGIWRSCVEIDVEDLETCARANVDHIQTTLGARAARRHCSVAAWYEEIWLQEALEAQEVGSLPRIYRQPGAAYAHLLGCCDKPQLVSSRSVHHIAQAFRQRISSHR